MLNWNRAFAALLCGSMYCVTLCVGCGSGSSTTQTPAATPSSGDHNHDHDHDHEHEHSTTSDEADGLSGLSAEDRTLAEAQKLCPVGGGELGSMGTPVKVEHEGKTIFLCCEHCREPFLEDPAKHLAELEKSLKESSSSETP